MAPISSCMCGTTCFYEDLVRALPPSLLHVCFITPPASLPLHLSHAHQYPSTLSFYLVLFPYFPSPPFLCHPPLFSLYDFLSSPLPSPSLPNPFLPFYMTAGDQGPAHKARNIRCRDRQSRSRSPSAPHRSIWDSNSCPQSRNRAPSTSTQSFLTCARVITSTGFFNVFCSLCSILYFFVSLFLLRITFSPSYDILSYSNTL